MHVITDRQQIFRKRILNYVVKISLSPLFLDQKSGVLSSTCAAASSLTYLSSWRTQHILLQQYNKQNTHARYKLS